VELLSDENPLVRENACWALGHLCARDATSALEDRAHDDDNADVRTRGIVGARPDQRMRLVSTYRLLTRFGEFASAELYEREDIVIP